MGSGNPDGKWEFLNLLHVVEILYVIIKNVDIDVFCYNFKCIDFCWCEVYYKMFDELFLLLFWSC